MPVFRIVEGLKVALKSKPVVLEESEERKKAIERSKEFARTHPEAYRGSLSNCCGQPPGLGFGGE